MSSGICHSPPCPFQCESTISVSLLYLLYFPLSIMSVVDCAYLLPEVGVAVQDACCRTCVSFVIHLQYLKLALLSTHC